MTHAGAVQRADALSIHDERSLFATIALAWPTAAGFGADQASYLRKCVRSIAASDPGGLEPVTIEWTGEQDAVCLSATLPEAIAHAWITKVINGVIPEAGGLSGRPAVAAVGRPEVLSGLDELVSVSATPSSALVSSSLRRSSAQGYDQIVVVGGDPSGDVGAAATFLAVCLVAAGPCAVVSDAVKEVNAGATVRFARRLHDGHPALTWRAIAPEESSLETLEAILSVVERSQIVGDRDTVEQAREFAVGNLNRAWRSPIELARTLVHYEVMGWGAGLILNPDAALASVDEVRLERAVAGVVRPIGEVLGRT